MPAWKILKAEHVKIKIDLYRTIYMDSGAQMFTVHSTHDTLRTLILPEIK